MAFMDFVTKGFSMKREPKAQEAPTPEVVPQAPEPSVTPQEQATAVLFNFQAPQPQGFNGAFAGGTIGNRAILVVSPKTDNEVFSIVEHLRTNEAVIVNFEGIPTQETQRRIDFLSGVACGLGGTIRPLDAHKYIMTPSGIGIKN